MPSLTPTLRPVQTRLPRLLPLLALSSLLLLPATHAAAQTTVQAQVAPAQATAASLDIPMEELLQNTSFRPNLEALERARAWEALHPAPPVIPSSAKLPARIGHLTTEQVAPGISMVGEIVVMEGDSEIVTSFGNDQYGLRFDNQVQNPVNLARRFYDHFPDEFDFIVLWTTFWDYGAEGLAYYVGIRQETRGIGQSLMDNGFFWGSGNAGRLQGFLNMKSISLYGNIADPNNYAYPVMGQEMTHRWLAFMQYRKADGALSAAMLGRDQSHWSSLMHAQGSVQDGNWWQDNGNGSFKMLGTMLGFSDLDLYGMGLLAPNEVEPWFLIENASYQGQQLNGLTQIPQNFTVTGTRSDIKIEDVISAHGPRQPAFEDSQKDFRIAFVLVTAPGQNVSAAGQDIASIDTFRNAWEATFEDWTKGRARVCSRASADCESPVLKVVGATAHELEGDGDGMAEPGEKVGIDLTLSNPGSAPVTSLSATLPPTPELKIVAPQPVIGLEDLIQGTTVTIKDAFVIDVGLDAPCGTEVELQVAFNSNELQVLSSIRFPLGFLDVVVEDFSQPGSWTVDPYGTDTAQNGLWERATPIGVNAASSGANLQTQSDGDQANDGFAFVTGAQGGQLGDHDIDGGVTTLLSPAIDTRDTIDPTLSYWTWHASWDFNAPNGQIVAEDNDVLRVELSPDDGQTWILLEDERDNAQDWVEKTWRILDFVDELPAAMRIRFTARDSAPQSLSEAGVDSFRVFDLQPICYGILPEPEPTDEDTGPVDVDAGPVPTADAATGGEADAGTQPGADTTVAGDVGGTPSENGATSSGGCAGGPAPASGLLMLSLLALALVWRRRKLAV